MQFSERVSSETLLQKWEKAPSESSLRFMKILLSEETSILETLTKKLKDQIDTTLKIRSDLQFEAKEIDLQKKLLKHQNYIKDQKHNLCLRDLQDFKEGKANIYQPISLSKRRERDTDLSSSETDFSDRERTYSQKIQGGVRIINKVDNHGVPVKHRCMHLAAIHEHMVL